MQQSLVAEYISCPVDQNWPLQVEAAKFNDDEMVEGSLRCAKCATSYPVADGIPLLFPPSGTQSEEVAAAKQRESEARDADAPRYDASVSNYQTSIELGAFQGRISAGS